MAELGRDDDVLVWTARGIAQTTGWQTSKLYDLACTVQTRRSAPLEVLKLRRTQHEQMPSTTTYSGLRAAAEAADAWALERDSARATLQRRDPGALIDALLSDGDTELAWELATADPDWDPGSHRLLRLAEARESTQPLDALPVYWRVVDDVLLQTDRRAYTSSVQILKRAKAVAEAAGVADAFAQDLALLREHQRRRPTLIAMLDKAGLR
jgi:uncharacterized Zn finger protein